MVFRLLHLTDLHISAYPDYVNHAQNWGETGEALDFMRAVFSPVEYALGAGPSPFYPTSFDRNIAATCTGEIKRLLARGGDDNIDAVIITGDLANTGRNEDLKAAKAFLNGYRESGLDGLIYFSIMESERPVLIMPGNHDRFRGTFHQPGGDDFEKVFGQNWDLGTKLQRSSGNNTKTAYVAHGSDYLAFIMCDFSLKHQDSSVDPRQYLGRGRVYDDRLQGLVDATGEARDKMRAKGASGGVVWLLHYPPAYDGVADDLEIDRGDEVLRRAAEQNVSVILAGHTHEPRQYWAGADGDIRVYCGGTATSIPGPNLNSIQVITLPAADAEGKIDPWQCTVERYAYAKEFGEWKSASISLRERGFGGSF